MSLETVATASEIPAPAAIPEAEPAAAAGRCPLSRTGDFLRTYKLQLGVAFAILLFGVFVRVLPNSKPQSTSIDEHYYAMNVEMLRHVGLGNYPYIVRQYIQTQAHMDQVMLPPTRCLYISFSYLWGCCFHTDETASLHAVSLLFSILTMLVAGIAAARMGGSRYGLAVLALMSVAPAEISLAHRALVDGFFAFWALLVFWLLWENLRHPRRVGWLLAYGAAIAAMVLTKENAFFAFIGVLGILALHPWLRLGTLTRETVLMTFAGALAGFGGLVLISGGLPPLIGTFHLLVVKAELMDFAYETGGGPWHRYLVDLLLVSPAVVMLAFGAVFNLRRGDKAALFLALFVVCSYAVMSNVRNGMNLRYATMWDMPLRYLAMHQLLQIAARVRFPKLAAVGLVTGVALIELRQYFMIFWAHDLGDMITIYLMRALEIVRYAHH